MTSDWGDDPYDNPYVHADPEDYDPNLDDGSAVDEDLEDGPGNVAAEEPALYYRNVDEFLRDYLRHVYRRKIDGRHRVWAADWWAYDEAVIRLEALWRAWEHLRLDPATGMSVWLRDHADHHMAVLMDPDGPFHPADATADENHTTKGGPLPYQPPPQGLFSDEPDEG